LAATIKSKCGLIAILKEGHGAIFEVSMNDEVIYTNNKKCGTFPQEDEIVQKIVQYKASG
jgi:predicted Rdx family selenoprotein